MSNDENFGMFEANLAKIIDSRDIPSLINKIFWFPNLVVASKYDFDLNLKKNLGKTRSWRKADEQNGKDKPHYVNLPILHKINDNLNQRNSQTSDKKLFDLFFANLVYFDNNVQSGSLQKYLNNRTCMIKHEHSNKIIYFWGIDTRYLDYNQIRSNMIDTIMKNDHFNGLSQLISNQKSLGGGYGIFNSPRMDDPNYRFKDMLYHMGSEYSEYLQFLKVLAKYQSKNIKFIGVTCDTKLQHQNLLMAVFKSQGHTEGKAYMKHTGKQIPRYDAKRIQKQRSEMFKFYFNELMNNIDFKQFGENGIKNLNAAYVKAGSQFGGYNGRKSQFGQFSRFGKTSGTDNNNNSNDDGKPKPRCEEQSIVLKIAEKYGIEIDPKFRLDMPNYHYSIQW